MVRFRHALIMQFVGRNVRADPRSMHRRYASAILNGRVAGPGGLSWLFVLITPPILIIAILQI